MIYRAVWAILATLMFLSTAAPSLAADKDPFAEGNTFQGSRIFRDTKGNAVGKRQRWTLRITERKGQVFKGEITLELGNQMVAYPVEGTAPAAEDGGVKFKGENGLFKHQFAGKIKKGEVGLEFSGRAVGGDAVRGTAVLRAKD